MSAGGAVVALIAQDNWREFTYKFLDILLWSTLDPKRYRANWELQVGKETRFVKELIFIVAEYTEDLWQPLTAPKHSFNVNPRNTPSWTKGYEQWFSLPNVDEARYHATSRINPSSPYHACYLLALT